MNLLNLQNDFSYVLNRVETAHAAAVANCMCSVWESSHKLSFTAALAYIEATIYSWTDIFSDRRLQYS